MRKKIHLLGILILLAGSLFANMPPHNDPGDGPTCDGNCGSGAGGKDDQNKDNNDDEKIPPPKNECPKCGAVIGSFDMTIPFGRMVHTDLFGTVNFKIYSKMPTPTLFSPQKLVYDFNFESYLESSESNSMLEIALYRPDGFGMNAKLMNDSKVATFPGHHCGTLKPGETATKSRVSTEAHELAENKSPETFERNSRNGSKTIFKRYTKRTGADGKKISFYRVDTIITSDGRRVHRDDKDIGIEVLRDSEMILRQVYSAADGLADIVNTDPGVDYEIRMYPHEAVGAKVDGFYTINAGSQPYRVWRIEKSILMLQIRTIISESRIVQMAVPISTTGSLMKANNAG